MLCARVDLSQSRVLDTCPARGRRGRSGDGALSTRSTKATTNKGVSRGSPSEEPRELDEIGDAEVRAASGDDDGRILGRRTGPFGRQSPRRRPDPRTRMAGRRSARTHARTGGGTGASPGNVDCQPPHRVHSTAASNALAESYFASLECELLDRTTLMTPLEARAAVFDYIEGFYNPHRRHSALGLVSPVNFEYATMQTVVA